MVHIDQSFPMYWDLPCREPTVVPIDLENTKLGKQLASLMNNTIFPFGVYCLESLY